jgi:hypothetical protein
MLRLGAILIRPVDHSTHPEQRTHPDLDNFVSRAKFRRSGGNKVSASADVRFGSDADIGVRPPDVRFTPESGHC